MARALGDLLDGKHRPETQASSRYMRELRIIIIGWLWWLVLQTPGPVRTVTVIADDWRYTLNEVLEVDPRRLLAAFRQALYRNGARDAGGWLIAFIHVDFDADTKLYQLHLHVVAAGRMLRVLRAVRRNPKFRSRRPGGRKQGQIYQKILFRGPLESRVPYRLTYQLKSFFSHSRVVNIGDDANPRMLREKLRSRIPEPYHSAGLLWLHRWRVQDTTLLVKLSATKRGLIPTKRTTPRKVTGGL